MKPYDHRALESKWQKQWAKKKVYATKEVVAKKGTTAGVAVAKKFYILDMFPYPSGEGLHVGHPKGYIATDVVSRMKRMQGYSVLHPMGFDAFGLPAENYAIKMKTNPAIAVAQNVKHYKEQLELFGFDYDWSREINTTDPAYYKWTQWIFLKLLEKGLAYQSHEPIDWCPSCKTGLAKEDIEDGKCERCSTPVEKKLLKQWVLKITDYAERLLADLDSQTFSLDWPASIKELQRNWIGKSEGMLFTAPVKDTNLSVQTFSAHFESCYADTFVAIAPDHPFLKTLLEGTKDKQNVLDFCNVLIEKRSKQGFVEEKESEGIFTGRYIVDPLGNGDLPIWVASFALADYGTGIVKCSAHDERDFAFAKKYGIKLKTVLYPVDSVVAEKVRKQEVCFTDMQKGILSEPKEFAGKVAGSVRGEIIAHLESKHLAKKKTSYRLRDWVFSRQRYWGEPIPVIHCEKCGTVPVPEKDLPVKLPKVKFYEPTGTGESPLAAIEKWVNTTCPKCGSKKVDGIRPKARRETNTMPQWAGSSWYYLRYMDAKNKKALVDPRKEQYWAPVDLYVGGAEHATRHLIYARFWHKFLYDIGVVSTTEPFKKLQHVGLIMAEDGRKMSKRWGNVVNPDEIIATYGADTLRLYEMFMGPFDQQIAWNTSSMIGSRRFIERVWKLSEKVTTGAVNVSIESLLHRTIKKVSSDITEMKFNTAISSLMILANAFDEQESIQQSHFEIFLALLAPFIPHVTEELWSKMKHSKSIHTSPWPVCDEEKIKQESRPIAIQIDGKVRAKFEMMAGENEKTIEAKILALPEVKKWIDGKVVVKVITIPGKLVSIVTRSA